MGSPNVTNIPATASIPRRLLVVEDSERDFALLVRELNRAGLTPECVRIENADQMRAELGMRRWDAILSDHSLPMFNSTAALEILHESGLDIPFIIVSGAIGEEQAVDAMKAGATDFVSKRNLGRLIPILERELRDAYARAEHRRMETEVVRLNQERETRLRQRSTLLDITNAVMTNLDRESLFQSLYEALHTTLPTDYLALALRDEETGEMSITSITREGQRTTCTAVGASHTILDMWETDPTQHRLCLDPNDDSFPLAYRMREEGLQSGMTAPLYRASVAFGILAAGSFRENAYGPADVEFLSEIARQVGLAISNMFAYEQIAQLKTRLENDKAYLLEEIKTEHNCDDMVGSSPAFRELSGRISRVAPTSAPVLILGETGTGKELIARAIHNLSPRRDRPLVKVNCAAISAGLVESELFGHVKGAFTGAVDRRIGRFEFANGGTLFLDEVGELPLETQAKLLRVLQEQEFEPVGSNRSVKVDTRLIAATNRHLEDAVKEGKFRSDLFYRLNVVPMLVPPLRERKGDIPLLVSHFLAGFSRKYGRRIDGVSEEAMRRIMEYSWPGNIRELENLLARAVVLSNSPVLDTASLALPSELRQSPSTVAPADNTNEPFDANIEAAERRHIEGVLIRAHWVIEGAQGAAQMLGLHPNTLRSRMKKLGIHRPKTQTSGY